MLPQAQTNEYLDNVKDTVQSFWHGLSITLSHLLRRPCTIQYPDRTPLPVRDTLPPRYRGFLEVDASICTGCQACERACPISCIQINLEKDPANPKVRLVTQFDIDEAKCMFCGLCVEPCPTGSIQHTREFEGTQRSVRNLTFRWSDPEHPFPVYKVAKGAEYFPRAPLGEILRAKLAAQPWDAPAPVYLPPEPPSAKKPEPAAKPAPAAKAAAAKPAASAPAPAAQPAVVGDPAVPAAKPAAVVQPAVAEPSVPVAQPAAVVQQAAQAVAPNGATAAPARPPPAAPAAGSNSSDGHKA